MQAAQFSDYGPSDVMEIAEAPEPHPGPGQVRIVVHASSINPMDWKIRNGYARDDIPLDLPAILGNDAAGVVDEIGEGVEGFWLGEAVFGLGSSTNAEFALLNAFTAKPKSLSFPEAAALGVAGETSVRALDLLGVGAGITLRVAGAAGGVGSVATQLAGSRRATVIGSASERNHDFLSQLGAKPVLYGDGLADRVRAAAPDGIDAVLDVVGASPIEVLTSLVAEPAQVVTIANFAPGDSGARLTTGGEGDPFAALAEVAELATSGKLRIHVREFPLADVGEAQDLSQAGHVRGKLVLVI
ncbi:MAG: NADP-dependent oxidoreductase [Propionibacteriaceae bacterium]